LELLGVQREESSDENVIIFVMHIRCPLFVLMAAHSVCQLNSFVSCGLVVVFVLSLRKTPHGMLLAVTFIDKLTTYISPCHVLVLLLHRSLFDVVIMMFLICSHWVLFLDVCLFTPFTYDILG